MSSFLVDPPVAYAVMKFHTRSLSKVQVGKWRCVGGPRAFRTRQSSSILMVRAKGRGSFRVRVRGAIPAETGPSSLGNRRSWMFKFSRV